MSLARNVWKPVLHFKVRKALREAMNPKQIQGSPIISPLPL
jgi:hypothetical protein